ncbi:MAG: ribose-phosphate diphosphokinase [Acidobacteriota bacterium]
MLSSVPLAHHGNEALLLELHTPGLVHYFEGALTALHLSARRLVLRVARRLAGDEPVVLGSVDTGRAKQVESLASELGAAVAFVFKRRLDGETTRVAAVAGEVAGKTVLIYDDMIRTGGSLIGAAKAYKEAGAERLYAIAIHGVMPGDAAERLRDSGLFERVVVTDSHPHTQRVQERMPEFLDVESVAPLLRRAVLRQTS